MYEKTSLRYRIDFNQNILEADSIAFSESVNQKLLNENILFFDHWGENFCEGFIDIKDYTRERKPEDFFYEVINKNRLFEVVKNIRIVLDDNGLEYKISIINNRTIEIETNSPKQGGLTIYYNLTEEEKKQYLTNGIKTLKERIKNINTNFEKYRIVSWR